MLLSLGEVMQEVEDMGEIEQHDSQKDTRLLVFQVWLIYLYK